MPSMIKERKPFRGNPRRTCPQCGAAFTCDLAAGKKDCWCTAFPPLMPLDENAKECLCPECLKKAIKEKQ
ncbi:cysteine-rich CWC family protein [bacterium]|nr:cysteine-rich CWC family protein [bacterium]